MTRQSCAIYSARRGLGILGGTFDPVHAGHLCLARAVDAVPLVRVELMPAGEPWQKSRISPGIHRLTSLHCSRIRASMPHQHVGTPPERCNLHHRHGQPASRGGRARHAAGPHPRQRPAGLQPLHLGGRWQSLTDFVHIAYCARDGVRESEIPESQALWAAPRMTEARKLVFSPSGRIARFEMAPHRASATAIRRYACQRTLCPRHVVARRLARPRRCLLHPDARTLSARAPLTSSET